MNAFILDIDLSKNAEYHCDAHVLKLILESTQMASTAFNKTNPWNIEGPMRSSFINHPINIWTRSNINNYTWMCCYGLALCYEYTYRYGRRHVHEGSLISLFQHRYELNLPDLPLDPPHQSVPPRLKRESTWEGAVEAYRDYYRSVKRYEMRTGCHWRHKRKEPDWYENRSYVSPFSSSLVS